VSDHLASFALQAAFPPSLMGRDSHDYYEASVAIGLAPLGDPTFVLVVRIERDLGGRLISLNTLTGHRSTSRRLRRLSHDVDTGCGTGFMRLSGGCVFFIFWKFDYQAIQLFAISRGPRSASFHTPEHDRCFPGRLWFPSLFESR
jgi:hypothetical protein